MQNIGGNMRTLIILMVLLSTMIVQVSARAIEAPPVPEEAAEWMPDTTQSFGEALVEMVKKVFSSLRPNFQDAQKIALGLIGTILLVTVLGTASEKMLPAGELAGIGCLCMLLLNNVQSLFRLSETVILELSEYGKLLLPVMTAALAAQGGVSASSALYIGTSVFDTLLSQLLSKLLMPIIYVFLAISIANAAAGEDLLKNIKEMLLKLVSWTLKTLATIYLSYMSLTGIISGTADAAAVKAAKTAISAAVPVIGSTLAGASETILLSAGIVKNTAGIYGIYAILALFLSPFLRILIHYGVLKATAMLCSLFDNKRLSGLIEDVSSSMGLLLALTGTQCLLLLVSMVCFLKGGT